MLRTRHGFYLFLTASLRVSTNASPVPKCRVPA